MDHGLGESGSIRTDHQLAPGPSPGAADPSGRSVSADDVAGLGLKNGDERAC